MEKHRCKPSLTRCPLRGRNCCRPRSAGHRSSSDTHHDEEPVVRSSACFYRRLRPGQPLRPSGPSAKSEGKWSPLPEPHRCDPTIGHPQRTADQDHHGKVNNEGLPSLGCRSFLPPPVGVASMCRRDQRNNGACVTWPVQPVQIAFQFGSTIEEPPYPAEISYSMS